MANPISSFIAGTIAGGSILIIRHIEHGGHLSSIFISVLVVFSVAAFFLFVVRDKDYEFKLWYGFDEMTMPRVVRGGAWLIGVALMVLVSGAR